MKRIIVIDNGNIMHRAIFAYRNNQAVPPTYTYMAMLIGYLKRLKFNQNEDVIMIAEDYGRSWRKDIDPKYKAQRKAQREEAEDADWWKNVYGMFNEFIPKLKENTPFYFIKIYRIEADDIASVIARQYQDIPIIMVSSDRDWEMLCQLPNVKIFSPITKKFKEVKNPMKVLLEKINGDISDNLLDKPEHAAEWERRKIIVNLLQLPKEIDTTIKDEMSKIVPSQLRLDFIQFHTIRERMRNLFYKGVE